MPDPRSHLLQKSAKPCNLRFSCTISEYGLSFSQNSCKQCLFRGSLHFCQENLSPALSAFCNLPEFFRFLLKLSHPDFSAHTDEDLSDVFRSRSRPDNRSHLFGFCREVLPAESQNNAFFLYIPGNFHSTDFAAVKIQIMALPPGNDSQNVKDFFHITDIKNTRTAFRTQISSEAVMQP